LQEKLADAGLGSDAASVAAKLIAGGTAAAIGGVAGGAAGAATALNVDVNNRQLHPEEKARIKQLASGDPAKEARLTAAACALVKCYAEYPEDSAAYKQLKQLADFGASDAFAAERTQLSMQPGMFGYSTTGVFSDANIDAAKKLNNTYQLGTRLVGTGKMALGVGGVAGSALTAPVSCATVIGCFANGAAATISLDAAYSGAKQLVSGNPTETYLNQGLQSLGMSPQAAAWVEAGLGIGSAGTAWSVANKAVDQTIALNKAAAASYRNSIVGDDPFSLSGLLDGGLRHPVAAKGNVVTSANGGVSAPISENYGVTFFGDDILTFYGPAKATIGKSNGGPTFFMPLEDASLVRNAHDAAVYTGMAPSAQNAYLSSKEIYGFSFPTGGLKVAKPNSIDAADWPHFLEGGQTAVKLEGPNAGYMVTPVREFVTPGSSPVPRGSVLFEVGANGEWIPLRRW
jgi:hypothetical protein